MEYDQRTTKARSKRTTRTPEKPHRGRTSVEKAPGQALAKALAGAGVAITDEDAALLAATLLRFIDQGVVDSPAPTAASATPPKPTVAPASQAPAGGEDE